MEVMDRPTEERWDGYEVLERVRKGGEGGFFKCLMQVDSGLGIHRDLWILGSFW